jgi:hypothetical protein
MDVQDLIARRALFVVNPPGVITLEAEYID